MNLVTSIIRGGGGVAPERLGARNEEKETFWQRIVERKNVIRVRLLLQMTGMTIKVISLEVS